jgi:prevent-host-death family protein
MPNIRPISDLRNKANEISDYCVNTKEPVFITRNGKGNMVILSMEAYERIEARFSMYDKLDEAEAEIASGAEGRDLEDVAAELRKKLHEKIQNKTMAVGI